MRRTTRRGLWLALLVLATQACSEGTDRQHVITLSADRARFALLDQILDRAQPLQVTDRGIVTAATRSSAPGRAHQVDAVLPLSGEGAVRISAGKLTLEVVPLGRSEVPAQLAGAAAVYPGAHAGADALVVVEPQRVEELVLFRQGPLPAVMEYQLRVAAGQGRVRQLEGAVELLDRRGVAWLRLEPPFVVDARGRQHPVPVELQGDRLRLTLPRLQAPALLDPSWITTGKMVQGRRLFTATLLKSGKVLVATGQQPTSAGGVSHCELYDPITGKWTLTSKIKHPRRFHTAVRLDNGKVLVAGGYSSGVATDDAQVYDPKYGQWFIAKTMSVPRRDHSAILLSNGKVLVTGGNSGYANRASAELYDPAKDRWSSTASMKHGRSYHRAVRLSSGKVLVVGGLGNPKGQVTQTELYDPSTGTWSALPGVVGATVNHTITVLQSGEVLAVGGDNQTSHLFAPAKLQWTKVPNPLLRGRATASLLRDGKVMLAGGWGKSKATQTVELFDPATNQWSTATAMGTARYDHRAVTLANNAVLTIGGDAPNHNTAEVYDSTDGTACKADKDCISGYCTDGVCCTSRCHDQCKRCTSNGKTGTCNNTPKGKPDLLASKTCSGTSLCYGDGQCRLEAGQPCTSGGQCVTDFCVDGVCCNDPCKASCKACDLFGKKGTCSPVPAGQADPTCKGSKACDGNGACKRAPAWSCTNSAACSTGFCTDGVCCTTACAGTCAACNLAGKKGTCTALAKGKQDPTGAKPCTGKFVCDGKGQCLLPQGATCTVDSQCLTDICKDGVCCDKKCDGTCESCKLSGNKGTCAAIAKDQDPDGECLGKDSVCGGACDGKRQCVFPGLGKGCGTCKACDGTGRCASRPPDDKACGVLDCDKLDTKCVDYQDVTTGRCISFGSCKPANDPGTCTKKTKLACGDAGAGQDKGTPGPDQGGAVETDDSGCAAAGGGGRVNLLWLGLLLLLMRRRPHR